MNDFCSMVKPLEQEVITMKDHYVFPAIFEQEDKGISIEFPDLPGCLPCAGDLETALSNAKEAMLLHLFGMEEDGEEIPEPTPFDQIQVGKHQTLVLVEAYMPPFRAKQHKRFIKKTLSLPSWINAEAEHAGINFSAVLQEALVEKLRLQK